MKSAFVTGGTGFIGRHLVERLVADGVRVTALVRPSSADEFLDELGAGRSTADLLDARQLAVAIRDADADTVFHLAGVTAAGDSRMMMRVNRLAAAAASAACTAQPNPPRLIHVSSLAAVGPTARGTIRRECDPPAPITAYGRSKRAGELAALQFADRVSTTFVRPGAVFGPRGREMLPLFRGIYHTGVHIVAGFAPPPLSLIHVEDLVTLLLAAADRGRRVAVDRPGQGTYFACLDEYPNYADLGRMISRSLQRRHLFVWHWADPLPWMTAAVGELVRAIIGQPIAIGWDRISDAMAESWAASPDAARSELGFDPPADLQQQIDATTQWYLENEWL